MSGFRRAVLASLVLCLAIGAFAFAPATMAYGAPTAAVTATAATPSVTASAAATTAHPVPGGSAPSSGRGTFFVNNLIPTASWSNDSCAYIPGGFGTGYCLNNTGNPSITSTPAGVMAVAYTAFTNATSCPGYGSFTFTEVGIAVSTNGGTTFGAPQYLDNPTCSEPGNFTSATSPAITALGNGTLVLAYLQYNFTNSAFCYDSEEYYFPDLAPCDTPYDQLVVSESFDNGTTWTTPVVINSTSNTGLNQTSWMPYQPAITSYGQTVYLAWVNWTAPFWWEDYTAGEPSTGLNMVTSTDGGQTWGAPVQLPAETEPLPYGGNSTAVYGPALTTNASGTLFVAYATGFEAQVNAFCQPIGCVYLYPESTMNVVVATSTDNGTTFSVSTVASEVPQRWNGGYTWVYGYGGTLLSPQPAIAVDPNSGEVYVAYTGGAIGNVCFSPGSCYVEEEFENLYVANSTDSGATWSTPAAIGTNTINLTSGATDEEDLYTPSIGVGANGTVFVDVAFTNFSSHNSVYMYPNTDLLFIGADNGSVWGAPLQPWSSVSYYYDPLWDGVTTSMTMYQGAPYFAWTWEVCPGNGLIGSCYSISNNFTYSQVIVSSLFEGTGLTVSFSESGLPAGANWTVSLGGNVRSGAAGSTLSVSGVPGNSSQFYYVPWVNTSSWGVLYASSPTTASGAWAVSSTVAESFSEYVELQVSTVPPANPNFPFSCASVTNGFGDYCANQNVTPGSGVEWEAVGASVPYGVATIPFPTYCYSCYNLTFLAWTGTGYGSWNTTVPNGTATLNGPVNETASFLFTGSCSTGSPCFNVTYPYEFHETGLPANTTWGVTVGNQSEVNENTTHLIQGGFGPVNFTVWTVPYNATYSYVPFTTAASPIAAPQASNIGVTFRLLPNSGVEFGVSITETGVPTSATGWGLEVGSTELGIPLEGASFQWNGGAPGVVLNASDVYGNAGVGAYLTGFAVTTWSVNGLVNGTTVHLAPGGTLELSGPATIVAQFSPEYWLSVPTPQNGTVTGTSQWVENAHSVTLTATADSGYYFVGWSGSGAGSKSDTANTITVTLSGPVTEVATFAPILPVFTLTVEASGLPAGTAVTVYLGGTGYTGVAPFDVVGVAPGTYAFSAPSVAPNGTVGTEYLVNGISSSLGLTGGELDVNDNGSVSLTFATDYLLTVNPTTNGSVTPAPGAYWEAAGTPVSVVATPNPGFVFVGWNGTGSGSSNGTASSLMVSLSGPVSETANFAVYVPPPAKTYTLTLQPSGLPTTLAWSASIGGYVVSGTGNLLLTGLNGSVTVSIGTVTPSPGTEWVPTSASLNVPVSSDTNQTVTFSEMFSVAVSASTGGTATPGSEWVASGTVVALTATPAAGYEFLGWNGTGSGAYTGATAASSVTVNGPVSEVAEFQPIPSSTTSSSSPSLVVPIAALVALLVVGLVVGLVLGRARGGRGPRGPPQEYQGPTETSAAPAAAAAPAAQPEWSEGSSAGGESGGDDGEEHIYGGGSG